MVLYGLIGYPVSHSRSAELFHRIFAENGLQDREYRLFPISDLKNLPALIRQNPDLHGLNVTIPWKEKIIPYLDQTDVTARQIGAVNTLLISRKEGRIFLQGFNTDAEGFLNSMDFRGFKRALVLGTGGASRAIVHALKKMGIHHLSVSRNPNPGETGYPDLNEEIIRSHQLIINTTPLGMYPEMDSFPPIPYHLLTPFHFLYDLVYNPPLTTFLKKGAEYGAGIQNGERMLQLQAQEAWRIWQGE